MSQNQQSSLIFRPASHLVAGFANPSLDKAVRQLGVYPNHLYPLFIGIYLFLFAVITLKHPFPRIEEKPHINQVLHYAQGDYSFKDVQLKSPAYWHAIIALPLHLFGISAPSLQTLRLTSLLQALLLPALITLISPPSTTSYQPLPRRILSAIQQPADYALIVCLNPIFILLSSRFTPGVSSILGLMLVWGLAVRGKHWTAAVLSIGVGSLRGAVAIWTVFVIWWAFWEIRKRAHNRPDIRSYLPYILSLSAWLIIWSHQTVPMQMFGIADMFVICIIRCPLIPLFDIYAGQMFTSHRPFFIAWLLSLLSTFTLTGLPAGKNTVLADLAVPVFLLRFGMIIIAGKEVSSLKRNEAQSLEEGREGEWFDVSGLYAPLPGNRGVSPLPTSRQPPLTAGGRVVTNLSRAELAWYLIENGLGLLFVLIFGINY
ncbi:hypothetical protein B9479_003833 [Cryptococcus floricola]|uniref:Dol-P-Glc:Glc(2)Man(9)GlcNAc(2)-PP-Dol alpha-1,2-glucosyltransferase n=1 Tax=Cryptococcus floricola TaxID=2591691 RepID=A0A5D3AVM2_9TREE|nr:hypothetical protein B9479_003833 [Cryptococcus floricola]